MERDDDRTDRPDLHAVADALATEFPGHTRAAIVERLVAAFERTAGSPLTSYRLALAERVVRAQLIQDQPRTRDRRV